MSTSKLNIGQEMMGRYTDQPSLLPEKLRKRIEADWPNEPILFYGLADMDDSLKLAHTWVVLGQKHIALLGESSDGDSQISSFERSAITALRLRSGLSCTILEIIGIAEEKPLATLRYSHRQRRAMEALKFLLDQQINGSEVTAGPPDDVYIDSITQPIKEAQASFARHRLAVVWRLFGYMKPYRPQIIWGMLGAVMLTILSLVPPYMVKLVVDGAVKNFQEGTISNQQAIHTAWMIIALAGRGLSFT